MCAGFAYNKNLTLDVVVVPFQFFQLYMFIWMMLCVPQTYEYVGAYAYAIECYKAGKNKGKTNKGTTENKSYKQQNRIREKLRKRKNKLNVFSINSLSHNSQSVNQNPKYKIEGKKPENKYHFLTLALNYKYLVLFLLFILSRFLFKIRCCVCWHANFLHNISFIPLKAGRKLFIWWFLNRIRRKKKKKARKS